MTKGKDETNKKPDIMEFTSELILKSENIEEIKAVYDALKPETTVMITPRGKAEIKIQDERTLVLNFFAVDFISLRAMISSYIRWVETAFSSIRISEES
ncbi:MAG: hypothetical protein FK732_07285 [Asgard group archaeon]|nr:hypothetical protein [Asgard group archaeon]